MIKVAIIIGSTRPGRNGEPAAQQENALDAMLDQVIAWGEALRPLREHALGRI